MTRKRAIEIVVANVKMGWVYTRWQNVVVDEINCDIRFNVTLIHREPCMMGGGEEGRCIWVFSYQWLEEKGYLKGEHRER